jgi:hypothetical protein
VDEQIVMPETRYEIVKGRLRYVRPSKEEHGSRHSKLSALLEAHVVEAYTAASDMLTRTSEDSDVAPDAAVYAVARDPRPGGRRLEELTFEVVSKQRLRAATEKAELLAERGVRRVFALDVKRKRALEWSRARRVWELLPPAGSINDEVFALPLPIAALVEAARVDDAVAAALLAKMNPVLERAIAQHRAEGKAEGVAEGKAEAKAEAVLTVLAARKIPVSMKQGARIRSLHDEATLDGLLRRAATCRSASELFRRLRRGP